MNTEIKKLIEISLLYGKNPDFVLGGGGNTSWKTEKYLYVKASGFSLSKTNSKSFVKMDREKLNPIINCSSDTKESKIWNKILSTKIDTKNNINPSIEVLLHNMLNSKYVVHTHPSLINSLGCAKKGKEFTKNIFGDDILWVPYATPGFMLANTVNNNIKRYKAKKGKEPSVIILQNHGVIITGNNINVIKRTTNAVIKQIKKLIKHHPNFRETTYDIKKVANIKKIIHNIYNGRNSIDFRTNYEIINFVKDKSSFEPISKPITPETIMYCKEKALFIPYSKDIIIQQNIIEKEIKKYSKTFGENPVVIAIQNLGIFSVSYSKKISSLILDFVTDSIKVAIYSRNFGGIKHLSKKQSEVIINLGITKYKQG